MRTFSLLHPVKKSFKNTISSLSLMALTGEGPDIRIFGMGRSNSCHFCENPLLNYSVKRRLTSKP